MGFYLRHSTENQRFYKHKKWFLFLFCLPAALLMGLVVFFSRTDQNIDFIKPFILSGVEKQLSPYKISLGDMKARLSFTDEALNLITRKAETSEMKAIADKVQAAFEDYGHDEAAREMTLTWQWTYCQCSSRARLLKHGWSISTRILSGTLAPIVKVQRPFTH